MIDLFVVRGFVLPGAHELWAPRLCVCAFGSQCRMKNERSALSRDGRYETIGICEERRSGFITPRIVVVVARLLLALNECVRACAICD